MVRLEIMAQKLPSRGWSLVSGRMSLSPYRFVVGSQSRVFVGSLIAAAYLAHVLHIRFVPDIS